MAQRPPSSPSLVGRNSLAEPSIVGLADDDRVNMGSTRLETAGSLGRLPGDHWAVEAKTTAPEGLHRLDPSWGQVGVATELAAEEPDGPHWNLAMLSFFGTLITVALVWRGLMPPGERPIVPLPPQAGATTSLALKPEAIEPAELVLPAAPPRSTRPEELRLPPPPKPTALPEPPALAQGSPGQWTAPSEPRRPASSKAPPRKRPPPKKNDTLDLFNDTR